jgi:hypothetical protein
VAGHWRSIRLVPSVSSPSIPASRPSLEVPLTSLWVWIFMNEVPSQATPIGGAVVQAALFGHMITNLKGNRASTFVAVWPARQRQS